MLVRETDLIDPGSGVDPRHFPTPWPWPTNTLPLSYRYAPGEDHDGVTVRVPARMVQVLSAEALDWLVPGFREEQIDCLLQALPKTIRRTLMPIPPKVKEIAREIRPEQGALTAAVAQCVERLYGVKIPPKHLARRSYAGPPASPRRDGGQRGQGPGSRARSPESAGTIA